MVGVLGQVCGGYRWEDSIWCRYGLCRSWIVGVTIGAVGGIKGAAVGAIVGCTAGGILNGMGEGLEGYAMYCD